jgi:phosphatidate cytidylyltransferase
VYSSKLLALLLLAVCTNDIAAYFGGRRFGGPKLAPIVSPGKTISGAVSGLLVGALIGVLGAVMLFSSPVSLPLVGLMVVLIVCAQLGDLNKSYIKRVYGVKDSSSLLPGHGGVYDRIDGILMAAPVLFFLTTVMV